MDDLTSDPDTDLNKDEIIRNLREQLDSAIKEKEAGLSLYRTTADELERLQSRQGSASSGLPLAEANQRDELRRTKAELRAANQQVTDLRATLVDVKSDMSRVKQEKSFNDSTHAAAESKIRTLTLQLNNLHDEISASQSEMTKLRREKGLVEQELIELQRKSNRAETKGQENIARVKDSVQLLETSLYDRDQALIREKQLKEEVTHLRSAITNLINEAGARTRQEVDNVKKSCNIKLTKLMEEMHRLELDCGEKQAELDRYVRDCKGLQEELGRVYREGVMEEERGREDEADLVTRASTAERERDEALARAETLNNQLRRLEIQQKADRESFDVELESLKDRLLKTELELQAKNEESQAVTKAEAEVRAELNKIRQDRDETVRENNKQIRSLRQTLGLKEREYEVKVQSLEDSHRQYTLQMRDMLAAQQKLSAKWKDECNQITKKLEGRMSDLREELTREKTRNEELTRLLQDSRHKTSETEARLSQNTRNMLALEARLAEAERKHSLHADQVQRTKRTTRGLSLSESRRIQQQQLELSFKDSLKNLRILLPFPRHMDDVRDVSYVS